MKPRALIAAGGTGGHFYPGLVLAKTLKQRGWETLMLVKEGDAALPRLETEGVPAATLDLQGLVRRPSLEWLSFIWKQGRALGSARRILRDFRPCVVVGMGGYVSFPALLAARWRGTPGAVHESNSMLGLANRACVGLGAVLLRGLPPAPGEPVGELTGTPVRPALWARGDAAAARAKLGMDPRLATVLVFGGSQGARGINQTVPRALAEVARSMPAGLQVLHLAGAKSEQAVADSYAGLRAANLHAKIMPYCDAMEDAYGAADLVISRAGASTIAELACQRKPAVLVPFPHATGRHQDANAALLLAAGGARCLPEAEASSRMGAELADLLSSPTAAGRRDDMSQAYARLALPCGQDAVDRLVGAVERIARS
jgi:UDP-N-acetylglucosamine--N-acetylmuramyl-(pentapeptide) pyrophosphoryl-undecaprenol N-acetylglucosamine transferase